jgi:peptide/nickel transport system permease protein
LSSAVINSFLAFPPLLLALVILTLARAGWWQVAAATGIAQIASFARVTRSVMMPLRSAAYVEAAYLAGASRWRIFRYHLLPNALPSLAAYGGVVFAYCLLNSAALSFLGLSGQPGIPDWGVMLEEGRRVFQAAPWVSIGPGLGITVMVYLVNRTGDRASG